MYENNEELTSKPKYRRSKLSYSCLKCREKRTKCDRKLTCTSCKTRESVCLYDTQQQDKPKRPNKDSLIIRLSKQLEFYKTLACKYTPKQELSVFSEDVEAIEYALGVRTLKKNMHLDPGNGCFLIKSDNYEELIDQPHKSIIIDLKQSNNTKNLNVFSDVYIFKNDDYANILFFRPDHNTAAQTSSNNEYLKHSKSETAFPFFKNEKKEDLAKLQENQADSDFIRSFLTSHPYATSFQRQQAAKFFSRLYETTKSTPQTAKKVPFNNIFTTFRFAGISENTIEDEIVSHPSLFLANIIQHVNQRLPRFSELKYIKIWYMEQFLIEFPFIDLQKFQEILNEVLLVDEDRMTLNIVGSNIHLKIAMVSFLLLIFYSFDIEQKSGGNEGEYTFENQHFKEYLELSSKLLMTTDLFFQPTEYKISVLCKIRMIIALTSDPDYSVDLIAALPTDVLVSVVKVLAQNIGISSQMGDEMHITDNNLRNHRKKILNIVTFMTLIENIMTGDIANKEEYRISNNPEIYDELDTDNLFDNHVYLLCQKRNNALFMIHECMQLFNSPDKKINLSLVEEKLKILKDYIEKHFSMKNWKRLSIENGDYHHNYSDSPHAKNKFDLAQNRFAFQAHFFYKSCLLKIQHVILVSCEDTAFKNYSDFSNNLFMKYIKKSLKISVECVLMTSNFINKKYEPFVGLYESAANNFVILYMTSKELLILLQFVCKCYVFKIHLQIMIMNKKDYSPKLQVEMHLIDEMNFKTRKIMSKSIKHYSDKFRFQHYQSFKLCLFFDFFNQAYRDGTIFNVMFNTKLKYDPFSPLPQEICDHFLMRFYLNCYNYIDDFKDITNFLNTKEVDDFIKECDNEQNNNVYASKAFDQFQKADPDPSSHQMNNSGQEQHPEFDENVNFEEYLRHLASQNFNIFGSSFMF